MTGILFVLCVYVTGSELLALVCAFKILKYDLNLDTKKEYAFLYRDDMKMNLIMFATCIWLPCIIIQKIRNMLR